MAKEMTLEQREIKNARRRKYYEENRERVKEHDKQAKRWVKYYESHKEEVRRKNLERYHRKKQEQPPSLELTEPPATSQN